MVVENRERLRAFTASLRARCRALRSAPEGLEELRADLEAAALPRGLPEHLYRRDHSDPGDVLRALFAACPLSAYVLEDVGSEAFCEALREEGEELYAYLDGLRLDALLVRTYDAVELRARLAEALERAAPFWTTDEARLTAPARAGLLQHAWIGLPSTDDSQLVDLLPERGITPYPTGVPGEVTLVQMQFGLPMEEGQ
jgi:hypothetical protein